MTQVSAGESCLARAEGSLQHLSTRGLSERHGRQRRCPGGHFLKEVAHGILAKISFFDYHCRAGHSRYCYRDDSFQWAGAWVMEMARIRRSGGPGAMFGLLGLRLAGAALGGQAATPCGCFRRPFRTCNQSLG
jgi:hypothetical protein